MKGHRAPESLTRSERAAYDCLIETLAADEACIDELLSIECNNPACTVGNLKQLRASGPDRNVPSK